jgi:predicted transcriptional regulator
MEFKFDSESKPEQAEKRINADLSTDNGENLTESQESQILMHNEIQDDLEEFNIPSDNLGAIVEETQEEQKATVEEVKMRVEDVKPAKELRNVIPFSNSHVVKDIARNPYVTRVILFLEEHGYSTFPEIIEAVGIQTTSLYLTFKKLKKVGFPVVSMIKQEQFNKRNSYYNLDWSGDNEQLKKMLQELRVWYDYFSMKTFLKALPEFKWVELDELESDYNFRAVIKRYGFTFEDAIVLLLKNGVVRVKGEGENFTHIKRVFDNFGRRISEVEPRDLIGNSDRYL